MKTNLKIRLLQMAMAILFLSYCSNPFSKIQGVYIINKDSLKETLHKKLKDESVLTNNLLNTAIENAIFEIEIKNDSINGLLFLAGESSILNTKIKIRNDSLFVKIGESEAYLIPTPTGLIFKAKSSDVSFELKKSDKTKLSNETLQAIVNQKKLEAEKKEFEQNLGKWQAGYFVDEFGDKTGKGYAYCIARGTHENSTSLSSDVFVKASIQNESLVFQIFDNSMSYKENFPNSEFGRIKIKYPSGNVESERIFLYDNSASEAPVDKNSLIFKSLTTNDFEIKLLIDLSTASEYYSDRYQFNLQKNNLLEILKSLKK